MRLIDADALKKEVQELLDLAVKRVNDTPTNSPCYRMYVEQENERARLIDLIDNAPTVEERPTMKWIPITYRPMTEEEVKKVETYFGLPLDEKDKKCFSCPMPEHGQEILISTEWGVSKDICLYDCDEGYFLDGRGDWEDVDAWMPLPARYEARGDDHEDQI